MVLGSLAELCLCACVDIANAKSTRNEREKKENGTKCQSIPLPRVYLDKLTLGTTARKKNAQTKANIHNLRKGEKEKWPRTIYTEFSVAKIIRMGNNLECKNNNNKIGETAKRNCETTKEI